MSWESRKDTRLWIVLVEIFENFEYLIYVLYTFSHQVSSAAIHRKNRQAGQYLKNHVKNKSIRAERGAVGGFRTVKGLER